MTVILLKFVPFGYVLADLSHLCKSIVRREMVGWKTWARHSPCVGVLHCLYIRKDVTAFICIQVPTSLINVSSTLPWDGIYIIKAEKQLINLLNWMTSNHSSSTICYYLSIASTSFEIIMPVFNLTGRSHPVLSVSIWDYYLHIYSPLWTR